MDNYDNFIFYGSWRKVLEGIASSQGKDYAKEVLWNIMLMSTAGDIETDDPFIINFIEGVILPVVDAARERYDRAKKGGQKGGRPALLTEEQNKEIAAMRSQGLKQTEIAKAFDVSVDTIRRSFGWQNWQNYLAKPAKVLPVLLGEKQQNLAKCKTPINIYIIIIIKIPIRLRLFLPEAPPTGQLLFFLLVCMIVKNELNFISRSIHVIRVK